MNLRSYSKITSPHYSDLCRRSEAIACFVLFAFTLFSFCSCAIPDDIPYPTVEAEITDIDVEGLCEGPSEEGSSVVIDAPKKRIKVYVDDLVDVAHLKIKNISTTNDAAVIVGDTVLFPSSTYPTGKLPVHSQGMFVRLDCRHPLPVILRTWQDYEWTLTVEQIIQRTVEVEGQVGNAVVDPDSRVAIIYVNQSQDLSKIKVNKFSLGGEHGTVTPDPTKQAYVDFTTFRRFNVKYGWSDTTYPWTVYVYTTEASVEATAAQAPNAKGAAVISGTRPNGVNPTVEYKAATDAAWTAVDPSEVRYPTSTSYEVVLNKLHTDVQYVYRVTFNGKVIEGEAFYFQGEQLENSSFENWTVQDKNGNQLYLPWGADDEPYWDSGNHGATTVGSSNTTYVDEDGRRYANLQSKYIVIKFAAGNIFTGKYLKTDGSNGVLSFGRPFTSRPQKLQFDFQYQTSPITRTGGDWKDVWSKYISRSMYENIKGEPDSCSVYIALGDWEPEDYNGTACPYLIRTKASEFQVLDKKDPHTIAYAQMTCGENVTSWKTEQLTLEYYNDRTPKYIIVVAASSKYGDYFTGGENSLMKVDDFKLIY